MKVDPSWELLSENSAFSEYATGRRDCVRISGDLYAHMGDRAVLMAGRLWLHTLCGITYAVFPDPRTSTIRGDVALPEDPARVMYCEACEKVEIEEAATEGAAAC